MKYVAEYGSAVVGEVPDLQMPPPPPSGGNAHSYSSMPGASIPDNSPAGVSDAIQVSDTGSVASVKVTTDISHTYRGDLRVTLVHGTTSKVIFDGDGGSADDLKQAFDVTGFDSAALAGAWTLKVEDTASQDVGTLNSWKLDVTTH
jgi:subtilisin-like proprotein convertase family protein